MTSNDIVALDATTLSNAVRAREVSCREVMRAYCPGCQRFASDIPATVECAAEEGLSADAFAAEDGTYNKGNGHFLCDACYVDAGCPSRLFPQSWTAP